MKNRIRVFSLLVLLLFLAGCGVSQEISKNGLLKIAGKLEFTHPQAFALGLRDGTIMVTGPVSGVEEEKFYKKHPDLKHDLVHFNEIFDPKTGKSQRFSAPYALGLNNILLKDGRVLSLGGEHFYCRSGAKKCAWEEKITASGEIFDPVTKQVELIKNAPSQRQAHTTTLLPSGEVAVVGGVGYTLKQGRIVCDNKKCKSGILSSIEIFDPKTNSLKKVGDLLAPRMAHSVILWDTAHLLVVGGDEPITSNNGRIEAKKEVELYDLNTNRSRLIGHIKSEICTAVINLNPRNPRMILIASTNPNLEIFDVATGKSRIIPTQFGFDNAFLLPDGRVWLSKMGKNVLIFDPDTVVLKELDEYITPRSSDAKVMIDGKIYIIAGRKLDPHERLPFLDLVEVFDYQELKKRGI